MTLIAISGPAQIPLIIRASNQFRDTVTRETGQHVVSICLTVPYLPPQLFPEMLVPMTPRERLLMIAPGVLFLVAFGSFEIGRLASRKEAERKVAAQQSKSESQDLLAVLQAPELGKRRFPFNRLVENSTGRKVAPFDKKSPASSTILEAIRKAADHAMKIHSEQGSALRGLRRINEGSRFFEDTLREHIDANEGLFCSVPETAEGREQRTGYPDLRIEHVESGTVAYLDPKLYEEKSRSSTLRSFYYKIGSGDVSKITEDAHHLLLGFSHDGADGEWTFLNWELLDLSALKVRLKAEFQASNNDLYSGDLLIGSSSPPGAR